MHGSNDMEYKWVVLTVTAVGMLMSGINLRVVTIGLPTIASALNADLETVLWVTQAYQFIVTIGLLVVGRLTDMFGRVKIYNLGFAIFTVGSALCALSQNGEQLIALRLVQGLGAAMLVANSIALITDATPLAQLGFAIGINQILFRVGSVLGLTLGGALIQLAGWQSVFLMNVPVGIFGTAWAYVRLKEVSMRSNHEEFDTWGFLIFTIALTSLLLAATFGTMSPAYLSFAVTLVVVSAILFGLFLIQEKRVSAPLLDLKLFSDRLFAAGNVSLLLMALSMGAVTLIASLYLQVVRGYGALEAGLMFIPMELTFATVGPTSGALSDRYGSRVLTTAGMGILGGTLLVFSGISVTASYWEITILLALVGVGLGLFTAPNMSSMMRSVPAERRGVASAVRSTIFNIGAVISISLVAAILVTQLPYQIASAMLSGTLAQIGIAEQMGFLSGIRNALLVSAVLCLIGMIPSAMRGKEHAAPKVTSGS
jgi:EmrB/QacA subfamily drug resistance transporter